ncbi:unnamed protein product [Rhodiola kirilowii]
MSMKQKIVFQVNMPSAKCEKRAKKIVALTEGLISMAIEASKQQLVVVGVGIDAANLATSLKKKVGHTTIVSIEEVKSEAKKKEEEEAKKKKEAEEANKKKEEEEFKKYVPWSYSHYSNYAPPPVYGYYDAAPNYPTSWFSW